ncbi:MAG: CsgE family curli-type amyloid fiber assembly protein [Serratia sp. (in: enterobacteria)]|uniref:CsgE family curli-type amyloid fiber assembly protein n=1 Tax=Serratia sp. (in: enterobacteria) TaxID=616 RepID=UPI003F40C6BF
MKKVNFLLIIMLILTALYSTAAEVEVPGLIASRTVTSVGQKFSRDFSDRWTDPTTNLTITEKPSARWGSIMTIRVGQDILFQTVIFPTMRNYDATVDQAVAVVSAELKRRVINRALLQTGDLSRDEF